MRFKALLIVTIAILSAYPIFAAETLFFSGFVFSGQSITVNDKSFIITLEWDKRNIMLQSGRAIFFVNKARCENAYNIRFCFHNTLWDTEEKKDKINISVYSLSPTITILRKIDNAQLFVGEEASIDLVIKNEGPLAANNFSFLDSFPKEIEITDVSFCDLNGSDVYWKGFLRVNDTLKCSYKIKPVDELERSLKAKVEYFDGIRMKDEFSSALNIKAQPYFNIKTQFNDSDKKIMLGENVTFIINISNNHPDEDIKVTKLNILLPKGFSYISTEHIRIANESVGESVTRLDEWTLEWDDEIRQNKSKLIAIKMQGRLSGSSDIIIKANYEIKGEKRVIEKKDSIEVAREELGIQTSFKDGESFDSGQEQWFKIYLVNPSSLTKIRNVKVQFNTTLADIPDAFFPEIGTTSSQLVLNKKIVMPLVSGSARYPFHIIITYQTEYGELITKRVEYTFNLESIAGITITHDISKASVEEGEEFTITTNVKNERNEDIKNIRVVDTSHAAFIKEGINSAIININAKDKVAVYTYNMIAPKIEKETKFIFKTTASYTEDNKTYIYEKEDIITVRPKRLELTINREVNLPVFMGQITDVNYVITNLESELIKNINLTFPLQQKFDLVGNDSYFIDKLDPGESFTLEEKHQIRAKVNESQTLAPTLFAYEDKEGNVFEMNSSETTFEVKYSYIAGPAFFIEKNTSASTIVKGDLARIILKVKNLGIEKGNVVLYDNGQNWSIDVEPSNYAIVTYELNFTKAGKFTLGPAVAIYSYLNKTIKTASNKLDIEVKEPIAEIPVPVEIVKPAIEVNITENRTELPKAKGVIGFVLRIIDSIKGLFG